MTAHASPEGFSGALSFLGDRCPVQMRKDTPRAFYASCAKAGLTVAQTARLGMVTYQAAKDFGDRHDLLFQDAAESNPHDADVVRMHGEGMQQKQIAAELGISRNTVRSIAKRLELRWYKTGKQKPLSLFKRMAKARKQLTDEQNSNMTFLMRRKKLRFAEALEVVGRKDLIALIEGQS